METNSFSAATPGPTPINLGPKKDFTEACTTSLKDQPKPCSNTFGTAIYATEEQEFWLLPERAASSMKEAMHALENQIAPSKSRDERIKGLDDSGLLEYFLEPKLSTFLQGEQRERMEEIEAQEPNIEMDPGMVLRSRKEVKLAKEKTAPKAEAPKVDTQRSRIDQLQSEIDGQNRIHDDYSDLIKLRREYLELKKLAIAAAKEKGNTYENGALFSAGAIEARARVQNYLEKRKALISAGGIQPQAQEDIAKLLETDKKKRDELQNCLQTCEGDTYAYLAWKHGEAKSFAYHEYTDAITKVSEYGLALPEYALISGDDITTGIAQFKLYLDTEKQQSDINNRLREKYKSWIEATGQNAQAPAGLVDVERAEWDRLQTVKQGLHEKAKQKVAADSVRRHLLWEPEQFEPQPIDRLVKDGFPLREVSTLSASGTPLRWLSLLNIRGVPQLLKEDLEKAAKKVGKVEGIPKNGDGGAVKSSAQKVFGQWLESQGALRIGDQVGDWFDTNGWFNVDKFYKFLDSSGYKVTELEDAGKRKEWGEHLKQVVFKKSVRGEVRLFDNSPQAQFVRCLAPPQKKLHGEVKAEGPSFSAAEGFKTSASASLSYDLARGEVELLKVDMPEREKAKDVTVDYYLEGNPQVQTLNLGRMSFHFGARAWGYAGASLMLAGSIELSPINGNTKYGATLSPVKPAQREDAEAKAERKTHEETIKTKTANGDTSPTPDLVYKSKGDMTKVETKSSGQVMTGKAANVQIENGMKANFNLFAGVQAGIELTGALNWAPPKALAALRSPPPTGVNNSKEAASASQWLTLANLSGSIGAAYGAGFQGNAQVSLDKGKFILNLKATVVLGPGASGGFKFEVGYEAVVELINIYRRELYKAKGASISWITPEAAEQASALNMLGAIGLDVAMMYMMGINVIMNLYKAMTGSGKGGPIAHTIVEYHNQKELEKWFVLATPSALGPIFMTLTSLPKAFAVTSTKAGEGVQTDETREYQRDEAYLLQQQAISRIVSWIAKNADASGTLIEAQQQFEDSCKSMNEFGEFPESSGQAYCENKYKLDNFMRDPVLKYSRQDSDQIRAIYFRESKKLGQRLDSLCKLDLHENSYVPITTMKYTGP